MKFNTIVFHKEDKIAIITLNRPERLNAVNGEMVKELKCALENVAIDRDIRVLIITGAGRAFCSGGDHKPGGIEGDIEKFNTPEEQRRALHDTIQEVSRRIYQLSIPTIAMINGVAAGIAFDWALACDLRIGSENARFRVTFTKVGLIPGGGGTWLLLRAVGFSKAAELTFTADFLESAEAQRIGVLNKLVRSEDLTEETLSIARRIAENPPLAIRMGKLQLLKGLELEFESVLEQIAIAQTVCFASNDFKEGISAIREKREPKFKGL
jgi:enoyl-CoA hydratase/carnithine racemase